MAVVLVSLNCIKNVPVIAHMHGKKYTRKNLNMIPHILLEMKCKFKWSCEWVSIINLWGCQTKECTDRLVL